MNDVAAMLSHQAMKAEGQGIGAIVTGIDRTSHRRRDAESFNSPTRPSRTWSFPVIREGKSI